MSKKKPKAKATQPATAKAETASPAEAKDSAAAPLSEQDLAKVAGGAETVHLHLRGRR